MLFRSNMLFVIYYFRKKKRREKEGENCFNSLLNIETLNKIWRHYILHKNLQRCMLNEIKYSELI